MRDTMMGFGWLFFLGGLAFLIAAMVAPAGEPFARTVNFEMMLNKVIYGLIGLSGTITGAVWLAAVLLAPKEDGAPPPPAA